jgi:AcrR family transcriptional regulator
MAASETTTRRPTRRKRADGERSRQAILDGAAALATIEGLEGLSIGRLADHIGMSKSGLYAHFGSKQELQLATIDNAAAVFTRDVVVPGLDAEPGLARFLALTDAFLSHLERDVFPGGCFFAATSAELGTRQDVVSDAVRKTIADFLALLTDSLAEAKRRGEVDPDLDPEQVAWEADALLLGANAGWTVFRDASVIERARKGIRARVGAS